jgi:O-acetyl-ADP-ribose deacetylase (regulator of RNase III)
VVSISRGAGYGFASIAFPGISTGSYGYPIQRAARIAIATVRKSLANFTMIREVTFCCFSLIDLALYQPPLAET